MGYDGVDYSYSSKSLIKPEIDLDKRTLYLDIDDVTLNTESYLRKKLGDIWCDYDCLLYTKYFDEKMDMNIVMEVMNNYLRIPFVNGALEGINILKYHYNIILCSAYVFDCEKRAKKELAKYLNLPIILCNYKDGVHTKSEIDMSNSILVDDSTNNLNGSNAGRKICFYKKHNFIGEYLGEIVFDWNQLIEVLV